MASGIITLTTTGIRSFQGRIVWSSISNGTLENSSQVTADLQIRKSDGYATWGDWSGNLSIGGDNQTFYLNVRVVDWTSVKKFTITYPHNSDGSAACYISGRVSGPAGTSLEGSCVSGGQNAALDRITRFAYLTYASNFNDEQNPDIEYSNPAGDAITKLEACIAAQDGNTILAPYRAISKTGNSYTFALTDDERAQMRRYCSKSNRTAIKFYVATEIGGKRYLSSLSKTLTIINATPILSPTAVDINETTVALTGNSNDFIRYKSVASVACNGSATKEATIVSYKITNGVAVINSPSGTINGVQTGKFVFTATDSRGNTVSKNVEKTCHNYVVPTISISDAKLNTAGELTFSVSGNIWIGSFGKSANKNTVHYKIKEQGGQYGDWVDITSPIKPGASSNYTATHTITGLDYAKTYTLIVAVEDSFELVESDPKTVVSKPVFDWSDNDFNFNVPVSINHIKLDYIVDQGASGPWMYRKWSSGFAECWCSYMVRLPINTKWGNVYRTEAVGQVPYPVAFAAIPIETACMNGNKDAWLANTDRNTITQTGGYCVVCPTTANDETMYINVQVVGIWQK